VQVTGKLFALKPPSHSNGKGRNKGAPTVTISTPPDVASYYEGDSIPFDATITDDKDVGLEGSITWESSYTGYIDQGNNFTKTDLTAGVHVITAAVIDSDGNTGSDSVMITVSEIGAEPPSTMVRWPRPVAIGISTGNANHPSAGTIACRVKDAQGNLYALSNTHVYAPYPDYLTNQRAIDHEVSQPGVFDIPDYQYNSNYYLGTLFAYVPINGSIFGSNTIDAAIAKTHLLGKSTPSGGYGTPKKRTTRARLGMPAKKFGRTTGLTEGTITGINATISINYDPYSLYGWYAWFVKQIIVESSNPFILPGDSGSLLVSNRNNPVGLLFAGDGTGQMAIANQIESVLMAFDVTIDGE